MKDKRVRCTRCNRLVNEAKYFDDNTSEMTREHSDINNKPYCKNCFAIETELFIHNILSRELFIKCRRMISEKNDAGAIKCLEEISKINPSDNVLRDMLRRIKSSSKDKKDIFDELVK